MRPIPVLLSLAIGLASAGARAESTPAAAPQPGVAPPEIDTAGLAKLLAKYKGRPVLVNVFASWCTPCKREMPALVKLMKQRPKLVIIGIDVDEKEADAAAFLPNVPKGWIVHRRHDGLLPLLPALKLPADWNESMPPNWTQSIPVSLIYNAKGVFETGALGELPKGAYQAIAKIAR